jgi:hypothetical protein
MSVINFLSSLAVASFSWGQQRRDTVFTSSFGSQAVENNPPLWLVSLAAAPDHEVSIGAWQALVLKLRGKTNQLADPHRPVHSEGSRPGQRRIQRSAPRTRRRGPEARTAGNPTGHLGVHRAER